MRRVVPEWWNFAHTLGGIVFAVGVALIAGFATAFYCIYRAEAEMPKSVPAPKLVAPPERVRGVEL